MTSLESRAKEWRASATLHLSGTVALLYVMTIAASLVAIQKCFSSSGLVTKNYIPQKVTCILNTL